MQTKKKGFSTISGEMFLDSFIFITLVSLIILSIFLKLLYDENMFNAKNSLRQCNNQIVTYTESMFHENAAIVEILSRNEIVINAGYGNPSAVIDIYNEIQKNNSNITYIYSGYSDGSLLISNYPTPMGFNSSTRPWYRAASNTDDVAKLVYSDEATDVWLFSQCMRLVDRRGSMVGAVSIDCSNESISRQLSTKYQYESQRSFILSTDGVVLIHPHDEEINNSLKVFINEETWNSIVSGERNYAEYIKNGIRTIAYFGIIPNTDFIVATAINSSEITSPIINSIIYVCILIIGISIVLAIILSRILVHRFAYPVKELGNRIQNLASGHVNKVRNIRPSNTEINDIAESIEIIVKDISNREEQRKAAEFLSFHDSMTGLYNRRFFDRKLQNFDLHLYYPLCIISCDVNGLKLINDIFGHAAGDELLLTIANCIKSCCRFDDVLARIGGDEFSVILPNTSDFEAQNIIQKIKLSFPNKGIYSAETSCSFGYGMKIESCQSLDEIIKKADMMMYEQKSRESFEMKKRVVFNIIDFAENEGFIVPASNKENYILDFYADKLCQDSRALLKDSYRLRKIGLCSMIASFGYTSSTNDKCHTEVGYRILSTLDDCRSIAGCVLHYMEHWDGTGWPTGLSGRDIPLLSRIIAIADDLSECDDYESIIKKRGTWYDPNLVAMIPEIMGKLKEIKN